ncbi:MAG: sugar porter family MFS transporter [Verrucomicrobiota bacterium]
MPQDEEHGSTIYLWFVCLVAAFGGLLFGYDAVVVSGTNSQVESQFDFSPWELGIYVSCVLWACAVGAASAGPISDRFGRKLTLSMAAILIFVSASWSGFASGPVTLIMARLLGGLGIGAATMVCPLYISEISPERHRGKMVTLFQLTITIGIVMCVFANWGIFNLAEANSNSDDVTDFWRWLTVDENWRAMFLAEAIPGILFLACVFFIPESPRWLVKRNRSNEAERVLAKVNGAAKARSVRQDIESALSDEGGVKFFDLFTHRLRKPLVLGLLICILSEACGVSVVFYYGPQIFEDAGFGLGGSLGGFATIAIVNFVATLFALALIDSAGRKKLITIGAVGAMLSHILIGVLFEMNVMGWPIVIAINLFIAFFACALGPVKFVIISEIFPNRVREKAIALATFSIWVTSAGLNMIFPVMQANMETSTIFFIYAAELILLLLTVRFLMPETKGRTIEEIERSWFQSPKG